MIIKVSNSGDGWRLFDNVDNVKHREVDLEAAKTIAERIHEWAYAIGEVAYNCCLRERPNVMKGIKFIEIVAKQKGKRVYILANPPVYFLNDDGKTIERV